MGGSGRGGVRVDVNEELKFLRQFTQKKSGGGWVGVLGMGVFVWLGVRVDVNEVLKFL